MCTCITYNNGDFYFGRNLDLECNFGEKVVITPRNYEINFKKEKSIKNHYAIIGMATVVDNYPLYAEASNEKGLSIAGLNFPNNAKYFSYLESKINITPFEFILWILAQFSKVSQVKKHLEKFNMLDIPFNEKMPLAPLHWMISDKENSIVIESTKDGLKIYDNPIGVLTNNPPFEYHQYNLVNYMNLTTYSPKNNFSDKIKLIPYGQGIGGFSLPGDSSPASRFIRASFNKLNSVSKNNEISNVSQFFHILDSVAMVRGSVITPENKYDITTYSCCINVDRGIYYYKTYENSQINAIDMYKENLESDKLFEFDLITLQQINYINNKY